MAATGRDGRDGRETDWRAVRESFERCLGLATEEREEALAAAPPAVRAEVEELLREHDSAGAKLDPETGHRDVLEAAMAVLAPGAAIGPYRIVRLLGRGGMGTVFLAEQEAPRRNVALKVFAAASLGGDAERRFRQEAEFLARLQHPGIAQVHEIGVHVWQGAAAMRWPFLAMEYVGGARTLAGWRSEAPRSERDVLDLTLQVCDAVQHAHERGVVHRDLKPQNVLVDAQGRAKVIDFGIARGLDEDAASMHARTRTGELLGTLRYMSPEQVRGDRSHVDTRTDVHALGVLAFELLTGRLPFELDGRSLPEVVRILGEDEALPLRRLLPGADPDLELILATALAKDPQRRFGTAGAFGEDLRRYLRREPIAARPPTFGYQLRMLAKRRRAAVLAILTAAVVGVAGGAATLVFAIRAHSAEERAHDESKQKLAAMRQVFDQAMRDVLELPGRLDGTPQATALRKEIIEQAMQRLSFVAENAPLDDATRLSLARAWLELGTVQGGGFSGHAGERQQALQSFVRARALLDDVLAADPTHGRALYLLIDVELAHGTAAFDVRRDTAEATTHWDAVRDAIERLRLLPPVPGCDLRRAEAAWLARIGHLANARGDFDEAVRLFSRARDLRTAALDGEPPDRDDCLELGGLLRHLGMIEDSRGRFPAALAAYEQACRVLAIAEQHPDDRALCQLHANVRTIHGYCLAASGRPADGEAHMRAAYLELERLLATDTTDAGLAVSLGNACQRLADHLSIQARYSTDRDTARQLFTEAAQIARRGLALARPLRDRERDMMTVFLVAECERIEALCADALK